MPPLGTHFPRALVEQRVRAQLKPQAIIKLLRIMDDGHPHEKRYIVLSVTEDVVCCVINSNPTRFAQKTPEIWMCQVEMHVDGHPFMDHTSYVDCSRLRMFATEDVVGELCEQPGWILGNASSDLCHQVAAALKRSQTISSMDVAEICRHFED